MGFRVQRAQMDALLREIGKEYDIYAPKRFVGGGDSFASGPMTSTFLLPLSLGACEVLGGNIMTDAFGVVAMVALTPLIAVQIMGLAYQLKLNRLEKQMQRAVVIPADSDVIVEFEEV